MYANLLAHLSFTSGYHPHVTAWIAGCAVKEVVAGNEKESSGPLIKSGPNSGPHPGATPAEGAMAHMLREAFGALPDVQALLAASPPELEREPVARQMTKLSKTARFALYAAPRATAAPRLRIRRARVEDHDDLLPVLMRTAADIDAPRGALSCLPASLAGSGSADGERFALARLIEDALHDPVGSCVLVAEAGNTGKLVGAMALTAHAAEVDVSGLATAYDLAAYDDLTEPSPETNGTAPLPTPQGDAAAAATTDDGGIYTTGTQFTGNEEEEAVDSPTAADVPSVAAKAPNSAPPGPGVSMAFRITMLCLDPAHARQSPDFLEHAFAAFPGIP